MLDYASMVQAEEIARADEAAKIARIIAGGGRLTLHCDRVNGKTYLTQAASAAASSASTSPRARAKGNFRTSPSSCA